MSDISLLRCEPKVDSHDPLERKLARRIRIKRRADLQKPASTTSIENFTHEIPLFDEEYKVIYKQKHKSEKRVEHYSKESQLSLNNKRRTIFKRELDKRNRSDASKRELIKQLEQETGTAQNLFDEIAVKWSMVKKFKDPYNIQEVMNSQKEKCDDLIRQKDEIITMLKNKIIGSEIEFSKEQLKQTQDITDLTKKIRRRIDLSKAAYKTQYKIVLNTINELKSRFIYEKKYKWLELHKDMEQMEAPQSEEHFRALEDFQNNMSSLWVNFEEDFRECKFQLLGIIDSARQELENIKAVSLLNSEKLDYNYQILSRREDENIVLKGQQKRRINKLQDIITDLRYKLVSYKKNTNGKIKKTTEMISQMQRNILDVEARADAFAKTNEINFNKLWEINRRNCLQVLKKILYIDKILHEQQMASTWVPPEQISLEFNSMISFRRAQILMDKNFLRESETKTLDLDSQKNLIHDKTPTYFYKKLVKKILFVLADRSGFLTESRLKTVISQYEDEQKNLVRLDHIFDALDLTTDKSIEVVPYFLPYCYCLYCAQNDSPEISIVGSGQSSVSVAYSLRNQSQHTDRIYNPDIPVLEEAVKVILEPKLAIENATVELLEDIEFLEVSSEDTISVDLGGQEESDSVLRRRSITARRRIMMKDVKEKTLCQYHHPLVISCIYVIRALNEFIEAFHQKVNPVPTTGERLVKRRFTISRLLDDEEITEHWKKITTIYSEQRFKIWNALLQGLKQYHEILKDRKLLAKEVVELRKVNEGLKKQLARYQDHSVLLPPICSYSYSR